MVSIATCEGMDGLGIESQCEQDFLHQSRLTLGPTQPPVQTVLGIFPGVTAARATDHPYLVPRFKKEYSHTSTPPLGLHGLL